ncbi:hypothetical protein B0H14DRAFT_2641681 [Mycena olivaceomarginata]|nr:hypothetical protein B0H14DRAFT_2641681 [Mycena olivaceomarginata]
MLYQDFKSRANSLGVNVPENLEIIETSFLTANPASGAENDHEQWLGQPWHMGKPFSVDSLDRNDPNEAEIYTILSTFSHFTFQYTNHRSVYVDFQGKVVGIKTTEGSYRVVDSRTDVAHTAERPMVDEFDEEEPPREYSVNGSSYFLGSLGETGLAAFQRLHNCTATCGIMQLNPLPLSFTN